MCINYSLCRGKTYAVTARSGASGIVGAVEALEKNVVVAPGEVRCRVYENDFRF